MITGLRASGLRGQFEGPEGYRTAAQKQSRRTPADDQNQPASRHRRRDSRDDKQSQREKCIERGLKMPRDRINPALADHPSQKHFPESRPVSIASAADHRAMGQSRGFEYAQMRAVAGEKSAPNA